MSTIREAAAPNEPLGKKTFVACLKNWASGEPHVNLQSYLWEKYAEEQCVSKEDAADHVVLLEQLWQCNECKKGAGNTGKASSEHVSQFTGVKYVSPSRDERL